MEGLSTCYLNHFCLPWRRRRTTTTTTTTKTPLTNFYYFRKLSFLVSASKDDNNNPNFDHWDQMEIKFGRMIGEDPKLTLAKIMGRKLNPNVSYLEIEKSYNRKGLNEIEILPFDCGKESSNSLNKLKKKNDPSDEEIVKVPFDDGKEASNSLNKLIRRPVPKEGVKFEVDVKSKVSENPLIRRKTVVDSNTKGNNLPNLLLRKPTIVRKEDNTLDKTPRMKIKPNLVLKMSEEEVKDNLSDIKLLRKPTRRTLINNPIQKNINAGDSKESSFGLESSGGLMMKNEAKASDDLQYSSVTLLRKPKPRTLINNPIQENINAGDSEVSSFGLGSSGELKVTDEAKASDDLQNSSVTLLRKPKPRTLINNLIQENINAGDSEVSSFGLGSSGELKMTDEAKASDDLQNSSVTLLSKPKPRTLINNPIQENINAGDSEVSSFGLGSSGELKVTDEAKASDDLQYNSVTLLRTPKPRTLINNPIQENINAGDSEVSSFGLESFGGLMMKNEAKAFDDLQNSSVTLLRKPKPRTLINNPIQENINASDSEESSFGLGSSGELKMTDEAKASDDLQNSSVTLLSKPKPRTLINNPIQENVNAADSEESSFGLESSGGLKMTDEASASDDLQNSSGKSHSDEPLETSHDSSLKVSAQDDESKIGLQPLEQRDLECGLLEDEIIQSLESNSLNLTSSFSKQVALQGKPQLFNSTNSFSKQDLEHDLKEVEVTQLSESNSLNLTSNFSKQAALQGRLQRLDQSFKQRSAPPTEETTNLTNNIYNENAAPTKDREDADWTRAEALLKTEVELISCSTRGFVASFGSLIGFLPYRNIATRWRFIAFESWLRNKGLDPSMYKHTLSISGGNEVQNMTLDDLLEIYDQEKIKFLSSFIGQKIKVNVILADRNSRRLMFSQRPKEKEELVEKKRSLMAKLSVGDIVKCCIVKITYFGIFVEVDEVRALIHQSEVSWDAALNTSTIYKIGQIVEAKVLQLDFELERITLSLKEITPDPLIGALEFVVGDHSSLDERLEAEYLDDQWTEVESLIKELQQIEGVQSVSKGRFFLSPGLAPTFQVYMASMFETQYKLLARSGNKVQEVLVQASLDKEQMKDVVLACTKRVE